MGTPPNEQATLKTLYLTVRSLDPNSNQPNPIGHTLQNPH